jgi:hypothetical protein
MKDENTSSALSESSDTSERVLQDVLRSVQGCERELQLLNAHPLIATYVHTRKLLFLQFAKGAVFGLGSVIGAGLIVSLVIYLLSQIALVPIIGEWVKVLLNEINR